MNANVKAWTDFLGDAAMQIETIYREMTTRARGLAHADDFIVRRTVQTLSAEVKRLRDARAAEIALYKRPEPSASHGKPTNVGDPTPKGSGGGGNKKGRA